jgi:hypothetical protein
MEAAALEPLTKLQKDVRMASTTMGANEARFLVDTYYALQKFRIRANNQMRALRETEEPHDTVHFFFEQFYQLEKDIAKALDTYSAAHELGRWAREIVGVGPVLAAGLLAHIPIERTPTPSALWKFAGLAPGQTYVKGQKRDWNASLKVLCWKLGDSFIKQSGRPNCYYGHLYLQRKEKELARNKAVVERVWQGGSMPDNAAIINGRYFQGGNCQAALRELTNRNIRDKELRATLESGKLPESQLLMRARRWAVKRFLLHYWQAAWWAHYHTQPPRAYVHEHLGHVDEDPPPVPFPS